MFPLSCNIGLAHKPKPHIDIKLSLHVLLTQTRCGVRTQTFSVNLLGNEHRYIPAGDEEMLIISSPRTSLPCGDGVMGARLEKRHTQRDNELKVVQWRTRFSETAVVILNISK